jgi:hypothetical protein
VPKISVTAVVVVILAAAVGYLAFEPSAARDVTNWLRRQVGGGSAPDMKNINHPNYTPVVPGNGL